MEEPKAVGMHDKRCRMASATMGETGYLSSSVSSWNRHRKCIVTEVLIGSPYRCLSLILKSSDPLLLSGAPLRILGDSSHAAH